MCWQTWISSCYRCPSFQQDVMMGWRHGGMTSWWGWRHDGMVHFVEFGIWGLSVDYLVADNSLSLFFPGLPQCSLRKDFQRGAERRERCAQSTFFQLYSCLETSTDWAQWEILPSSVPGDLVERRNEWGISFWSFLWKVWRWFLKYIPCSKEMLPGSWFNWTVCFIFKNQVQVRNSCQLRLTISVCEKTTWLIVFCSRIRLILSQRL